MRTLLPSTKSGSPVFIPVRNQRSPQSANRTGSQQVPPVLHDVLPASIELQIHRQAASSTLDQHEQEADRLANRVMQMPDSISRSEKQQYPTAQTTGSGEPLPRSLRNFFEPRLDFDLSRVRIHTDTQAARSAQHLNARAYTIGQQIVFGAGQYAPDTITGRHLLAHELAHVYQQKNRLGTRLQRKIDDITTSGCNITIRLGIGIYGSRATPALAQQWQQAINTHWSKDAPCPDGQNACPVTMAATVRSYSTAEHFWQVSESNRVFVEKEDYRSKVLGNWGKWAVDEDALSVAHETGHLMGLIDRYWQIGAGKSMPGFKHDIMGNYNRDLGYPEFRPTEFGRALSSVLRRHRIVCPCCDRENIGHVDDRLQEMRQNVSSVESPQPLDPVVPNLQEMT